MKNRIKYHLLGALSLALIPGISQALLVDYGPLSDEGGTGTAEIEFTSSGNTFTATIKNTSPTTLD